MVSSLAWLVERTDDVQWTPKSEALQWVRSLRDQALRAGTRFFFKQGGGPRPTSGGRMLDGRQQPGTSFHGFPTKYGRPRPVS
jgi:protein gp37